MDRTELEIQAEQVYPMPLNPCVWTVRKIEYLRSIWIDAKLYSFTSTYEQGKGGVISGNQYIGDANEIVAPLTSLKEILKRLRD